MLRKVIGSLGLALALAGCGTPPEEDDDFNGMPTEAELIEAASSTSKQITSFASGDQTRRETGIHTWKVHQERRNLLVSGYNKNGRRVVRNWIWATGRITPAIATGYFGNVVEVLSTSAHNGIADIHVGGYMSEAKKARQHLVLNGIERDFRKKGRFGCGLDTLACAVNTAKCYKSKSTLDCGAASISCSAAWESCEVLEKLEEIGMAIGEAIATTLDNCASDPTICNGT